MPRGEIDRSQLIILSKIASYLQKEKRDPDFIQKIKGSSGFCNGISTVWLYSKWSTFHAEEEREKNASAFSFLWQWLDTAPEKKRDDSKWFNTTVDLITTWDGQRELTQEEKIEFDRFISLIEYFQSISDYLPSNQSMLHAVLEDTKGRIPKKEYSIGSLLTGRQLIQLLWRRHYKTW